MEKKTYFLYKINGGIKDARPEELVATFSNKAKAIKEGRRLERIRVAGNGLRAAEGSRERYKEKIIVTDCELGDGRSHFDNWVWTNL